MDKYVTSHTLLARALRNQDQGAWDLFFVRYRRYIVTLLRNLGVDADELDDLTQEVMVTLWRRLDSYDKSRSKFRTWLASVVRFSAMNARRKHNSRKHISCEDLDTIDDHVTDEHSYLQSAEVEWKKFIMETALNNIRSKFSAKSIRVFEMSLDDCSGDAIATELELSVDNVYTMKRRVKKRLIQEVYFLQKDLNHEC